MFLNLLLALSLQFQSQFFVSAFTNGTLLPPYLCGPSRPDFAAGTLVALDGLPKSLGGVIKYFVIPGAGLTVANYHNQNSTIAKTNLLNATLTTADGMPAQTIQRHGVYNITMASKAGDAFDGLLLFAIDQSGEKVGTFTAFGPKMQPFPGCGPNNVGIVHNALLSDNATYSGIVWQATHVSRGDVITLTGLAVTDGGFGFHMNNFTVV